MTLAEMWTEEGREEDGAATLFETAIQLQIEKFGKFPQAMKESIMHSDTTTLKLALSNIFIYERQSALSAGMAITSKETVKEEK